VGSEMCIRDSSQAGWLAGWMGSWLPDSGCDCWQAG